MNFFRSFNNLRHVCLLVLKKRSKVTKFGCFRKKTTHYAQEISE